MFTVEQINEKWHVCRGDLIVSPGYRFKEHAERELTYKQVEEYRILVSGDGGYHPQWRWSPDWLTWFHFKQKSDSSYVIFKSLDAARQFMESRNINTYEVVQEDRKVTFEPMKHVSGM